MRARIFRAILRFAPAEFRRRFADELLDTARSLDHTHPLGPTALPAAVLDAIVTIITVRRELAYESRLRRRSSEVRGFTMIGFTQELRVAVRSLRRDVAFTTFVVLALTLGIGANAVMFGIVDRLLLSGPPHVREAGRVVRLTLRGVRSNGKAFATGGFGYVSYDLARRAGVLEQVATYTVGELVVGAGADTRTVRGGAASAGLFPMLGVAPSVGRFFSEEEDAPDRAVPVAVLSHGAWQNWYGGRQDIVGQDLIVAGVHYAIVGVAPRGFTGPQFGPVEFWLPINLKGPSSAPNWKTTWNAQWLDIVGRLKPGVSETTASDELTAIHQQNYDGKSDAVRHARIVVAPITAAEDGSEPPEARVASWLAGIAIAVFVITCANVANLLLARGVRRGREVALRAALGASAGRIARLLLVESMILAALGGAGGVLLALVAGGAARTVMFGAVAWENSPVDWRVLLASALLAAITGLVTGVLPMWRATRPRLVDAMASGTREGGGRRSRARLVLTLAQTALSFMLLIGAGLFVQSLWRVQTLHLGVDADKVLVVEATQAPLGSITGVDARNAERSRRRDVAREAVVRLRDIPGVERASVAVGLPFGNRFVVDLRVPGVDPLPQLASGPPSVSAVASDYFDTVGTRIVRGRPFGPADRDGTEPVAIVSALMARTIWGSTDPIDKCLISGPDPAPCRRIVGIADDTYQDDLREIPVMHYYIPFGQEEGFGGTALVVRSAGDPSVLGPTVKHIYADLDATIRSVRVRTIQDAIDPQTRSWRVGAAVFTAAGLLSLFVAGIGMYSVTSYLVADRRQEIAVRVALGARRIDVILLVLRGHVATAVAGTAIGTIGALAAGSLVEPLLFKVSPRDPWVFAGVGGVLVAVALIAGLAPAARANRVDPLKALRAD